MYVCMYVGLQDDEVEEIGRGVDQLGELARAGIPYIHTYILS